MKKWLVISLLLCLIGAGNSLFGQDKLLHKANDAYEELAYKKAIRYYEKYLQKGFKRGAVENLANSYRLVNDFKNAAKWYEKLVGLKQVDAETYLRYGQMLMSVENYDDARKWLEKFAQAKPDDPRGPKFLADLSNLGRLYEDTARYSLISIPVNSPEADFAPAFYGDRIMFSTGRPRSVASRIYDWDEQAFLDLWSFKMKEEGEDFSRPKPFRDRLNTNFHDATATFDRDGKLIFFTRSNVENGKKIKDDQGVVHLKLYYGDVAEEGWKNLRSLPFNSDEYSVGHPTLSYDGKVLFFISDMPGGYGGTDIYYSLRRGDAWSDPVNLGPRVNTPGNEMFPFIHETGQLWFASNGHGGLGGLDIFYATRDTSWGNIVNPGAPLNSPADDFSAIINPYGTYGFMASNREGGEGSDDVYFFRVNRPMLEAVVVGLLDTVPVEGAQVVITETESGEEIKLRSLESGRLSTWLEKDKNYTMTAQKTGYLPFEIDFNTQGMDDLGRYRDTFWLDQPPLQVTGIVRQKVDGAPIVDADIRLVNENEWMQSNEEGYFSIYLDPKLKSGYDWNEIENEDCFRQKLPSLCYRFFEQGMMDLDTTQFAYEWDLGDGTKVKAPEVEHCFSEPGTYLIQLNMIDTLTGDIAFTEVTYQLEIEDPGKGYILSEDTFRVKSAQSFECDELSVEGCAIQEYLWDFGDGTVMNGKSVNHTYRVPGTYEVKLDLRTTENSGPCQNCVFKKVTVLPPDVSLEELRRQRPTAYLDPSKSYFFRISRPGYIPVVKPYTAPRLSGFDTIFVDLLPLPDKIMLRGVVLDTKIGQPLRNVEIRLVNDETGEVEFETVSPDGRFSIPVSDSTKYTVETRVDGFLTQKMPLKTTDSASVANLSLEIDPKRVEVGQTFVLYNIYYDFNESDIRPDAEPELDKLVGFLTDNPGVEIELSAHTDARGNDGYNERLSQARAESAVNYLLSKGIDGERVVARGYGEQKLLNQCHNGIVCAEEFHQQNRRTEFTITGYSKPLKSVSRSVHQLQGKYKEGGYTLATLVDENAPWDDSPAEMWQLDEGGEAMPQGKVELKETEPEVRRGNVPEHVYSIQLAMKKDGIPNDFFDRLGEYGGALFKDWINGNTRYRVGNVANFDVAKRHLGRLRAKGYKDAFIILVNPTTGDAVKIDEITGMQERG